MTNQGFVFTAEAEPTDWRNAVLQINITLTGIHAALFERLLAFTTAAPGPKFDRNTLAASLLQAILEDDALNNDTRALN